MGRELPREIAERFAAELPAAIRDAPEHGTTMWALAADRGVVLEGDILILHETELAFLIGRRWVVEQDATGEWQVREWLENADPRYADYEDMLNPHDQDHDD